MLNPAYQPVTLRATGAPNDQLDVVMLALDTPAGDVSSAHRFLIGVAEAEQVALALLHEVAVQRERAGIQRFGETCPHSLRSSGSPSFDGSPQDGQSVTPLASSSATICGVR